MKEYINNIPISWSGLERKDRIERWPPMTHSFWNLWGLRKDNDMNSEVVIKNVRGSRRHLADRCRCLGQKLLETAGRLEDAHTIGDLYCRFNSAGEIQGNGSEIDLLCGELAGMLRIMERKHDKVLIEA